jgi:DNA-binding response OmpR family regulator
LDWHGSGRVLLVDDEPSVRTVAMRALGRLGFEVTEASGGLQALRIFGEAPEEYVAVVLDLTMPDLDGEKTLHRLRAIRTTVPVLLTSGYGEQALSERFPDMPDVGFIQKPFSLDALADRLRVLLES